MRRCVTGSPDRCESDFKTSEPHVPGCRCTAITMASKPSVTSFFAKQPGAWNPPESRPAAACAASAAPLCNAPATSAQSKLQAFLGPPKAGSWVPPPQSKFSPPRHPILLPLDVLDRLGSVRRPSAI